MKRMILMVVAMMSMTMTFAKTENVQSTSNDKSLEINIDMRRLGETLGLTFEQIGMVEGIYDNFNSEMRKATTEKWYKRGAIIDKAVKKGIISRNTAKYSGGGVYSSGSTTLESGSISSNRAIRSGGGIYLHEKGL